MNTTPETTPRAERATTPFASEIAVLGLGAMGSALAAALLAAGRSVTVWNRTSAKAAPLLERGARVAAGPAEALGSAPVVVTCLLDHAAFTGAVGSLPSAGTGNSPVLVDLTTRTPAESRQTAELAAQRGWDYLDGAVMAVPDMIGGPEGVTLYSGERAIFARVEPLLRAFGTASHVGDRAGLASLRDLAMLSAMYTTTAGLHQAIAIARSAGIAATDFVPELTTFVRAMVTAGAVRPEVFDSRDYRTAGQDLVFTGNAVDLIVRAAREEGVEPRVLTSIQTLLAGEIDRGHGRLDTAALVEAFRRDAA